MDIYNKGMFSLETQLEGQFKGGLNPWISIWTRPRATMKEIFQSSPKGVFLLFLVGAFVQVLDRAAQRHSGDSMDSLTGLMAISLIGSLIGAATYYYLLPVLLRWVGNKLGGRGTTERVRYSVAYSYIPIAYSLLIVWLPSLFLFGMENFTTHTPLIDSSTTLTLLFFLFGIIDLVIGIWAIIIFLKCLGEAHQFSAWKAFFTTILSVLIFIGPLIVIGLLVVASMG
jgi:hypothetical protein